MISKIIYLLNILNDRIVEGLRFSVNPMRIDDKVHEDIFGRWRIFKTLILPNFDSLFVENELKHRIKARSKILTLPRPREGVNLPPETLHFCLLLRQLDQQSKFFTDFS